MKRFAVGMAVLALALAFGVSSSEGQGTKTKGKFKKILNKIDPEIKAAQLALVNAKNKLERALADEVLGEKGKLEVAVINKLKASLAATNTALRLAREAQIIDKGSD